MAESVVDASAVLAYLRGEPIEDGAVEALFGASMSAVNVAEVASKLIDFGTPEDRAADFATRLDLEVVPFDMAAARGTAELRSATRSAGLSLGDRACLELAGRLGYPAWTADRSWQDLDTGATVRLVR